MSQLYQDKNIYFFGNLHDSYVQSLASMDTYKAIRQAVGQSVWGSKNLLDVGNGLVFNYDVTKIDRITALDLFDDKIIPEDHPKNISFKKGSALKLPEKSNSFDTVLMELLLHHLVGKSAGESLTNVAQAISEAFRVLIPGGKLVVVESCIPRWFYEFEKIAFKPTSIIVSKLLAHPMALQYPEPLLTSLLAKYDKQVISKKIPKGKWLLQFGFKFPGALTPIDPWIFVAHKQTSRHLGLPAQKSKRILTVSKKR